MSEANGTDIKGGRNLIILGVGAIAIAIISTAASLQIYRATGDIYLDRSRPGYISEDEKHNTEDDQKEQFASDGEVNENTMNEYLEELSAVTSRIQAASNDFAAGPLSDETLGISPSAPDSSIDD